MVLSHIYFWSTEKITWNDHQLSPIRGALIMFCNLDELTTSFLCFLHCSIDQFRNTCDQPPPPHPPSPPPPPPPRPPPPPISAPVPNNPKQKTKGKQTIKLTAVQLFSFHETKCPVKVTSSASSFANGISSCDALLQLTYLTYAS